MTAAKVENLKAVLREYLDEKTHAQTTALAANALSIWLWGFMCGYVFSYTSLVPVLIGLIAGFGIARKNIPLIDHAIAYVASLVTKFREKIVPIEHKSE